MSFAETRAVTSPRTVKEASGICNVTIGETVLAGDCLAIVSGSTTWVVSASSTSGYEPKLIAIESGVSGDTIEAALMAIIEVETTSSNVATLGEEVSLSDTAAYEYDQSNYPDVGFVMSVGGDSLSAVLLICPLCPQLTALRS